MVKQNSSVPSVRTIVDNFARDLGHYHKNFIGMDELMNQFRQLSSFSNDSYPPYNVERVGENQYRISIALAGFSKDDVEVFQQGDFLKVSSVDKEDKEDKDSSNNPIYLHRGIAKRSFMRMIQIATDIQVVGASMENGLLNIDLERIIPEKDQPKQITVK